ncbi:hypothetical protein [Helicobacter sp. MIT 14-3879]|uniref:hypothetical protein n=1 Tax=Helicobacter sp. MIT 14-3879 TaxID=2040649 RepID=UPI000E1F3498|nr:hypothetical protein [Helicobacter sp. MIT 14-3879]RDU63982.1 hypothetical protein CQA44_04905 [Helicobacter sp. MIT 14-3879]
MDKHLLASIYDIKGEKEKVVKICRNILDSNPKDKEAEETLRRIATKNIDISELNKDMYNFFIKANSKDELNELERWLIGN